jgi:uncharacterized protein (TIGR03435 family)
MSPAKLLPFLTLASVILAIPLAGQNADVPVFEVVSIRPQDGDPGFIPSSPDRFIDVSATLKSLVTWAWSVHDFQVSGGPSWADSRRFDVSARSPRPVSEATMRLMVRRLLADRFQLQTRTESRQMPRYVLRTARPDAALGPGMAPTPINCAEILAERFGAPAGDGRIERECVWRVGISPPVARMFVDGAPLSQFAGLLERLLRRKVVDATGLNGAYDIRLEFSSDQLPIAVPSGDTPAAPPRDGLSVFTALEEQLGLRLQAEQGPVDVIVIESAQLPAPN